jgi:hypothetical protein
MPERCRVRCNPDNLRQAAARKSAAAQNRAEHGLREMVRRREPITYRGLARTAGVALNFLYCHGELLVLRRQAGPHDLAATCPSVPGPCPGLRDWRGGPCSEGWGGIGPFVGGWEALCRRGAARGTGAGLAGGLHAGNEQPLPPWAGERVPTAVGGQTERPVDDAAARLTDGGILLVQAKKGLRLDRKPDSPLADALAQVVQGCRTSHPVPIGNVP